MVPYPYPYPYPPLPLPLPLPLPHHQVAKELSVVAPKLSLLCVYGGSPMGPQCNALRNGVDLIVGTPGRLKDLNERGALALESVRIVTLDEADMMLDMGFQVSQ